MTLCKEHCNARNDKFSEYLVLYTIKNQNSFQFSRFSKTSSNTTVKPNFDERKASGI